MKREHKHLDDYKKSKREHGEFGRMRPSVQLSKKDKSNKRQKLKQQLRKELDNL